MYQGVVVPLVTPLDTAGAVCRRSVEQQVESLRGRVDGLMPALSTGEGWRLDETQWTDVVTHTVRAAGGLPVFAGVEVPSTEAVIARARLAAELGVSAVVVTSPFGEQVTQEQILAHYEAVSDAADIDLFIYNEQAVSANTTEVQTLLQVFKLPRVVGIKESSGSTETTRQLVAAGTGIPVFAGWENLLLASSPVDGFIGPLAVLEPELLRALLDEPSQAAQDRVDEAVERYGLLDDEWYRLVKRELHARGVIATELLVGEGDEP